MQFLQFKDPLKTLYMEIYKMVQFRCLFLSEYCVSLPSICFKLHAEEKTSCMKQEDGAHTLLIYSMVQSPS